MSDHGFRQGPIQATPVGQIEDNNPFLFLTVPKSLRRNCTFIQTLKDNSRQLISHFDIYATLVDIVNVSFQFYFKVYNIFSSHQNLAFLIRWSKALLCSNRCLIQEIVILFKYLMNFVFAKRK